MVKEARGGGRGGGRPQGRGRGASGPPRGKPKFGRGGAKTIIQPHKLPGIFIAKG